MHRWSLPLLLLAAPAWAEPPTPRAVVSRGHLVFDGEIQRPSLWPDEPPEWALASPAAVARYDRYRWQQRTATGLVATSGVLVATGVALIFADPPARDTAWGDLSGLQQAAQVGAGVGAAAFLTGLTLGLLAQHNRLGMAAAYEGDRN